MVARALIGFLIAWASILGLLYCIWKSNLDQKIKFIKFLLIGGITATLTVVVLFFIVQIF